jgi:ketosteroid isomerase-like protein
VLAIGRAFAERDTEAAMSPENLERYGRMVQAWQRGDLEAWLDDAQDGEMRTSGKFPGSEPVYRGRDGMRAFWDLLRAP